MRHKYATYLLALTCMVFCAVNSSWSQKITASDSTGCAPFVGIVFTGIPGATNINWDFGDGGSAGINIPTHTFSTPGNYTVKYTAIVSGSSITQTIPIKVFGKPIPKFTTPDPKKGCIPLTVHFTDQSTGGGGSAIKTWEWAFGDGGINTSNTPTPAYIFNLAGQFDVSLKITDANGCDSSSVIKKYISTSKKPTIVVTNTPLTACVPPLTVTFNGSGSTSNSTTGSTLTYFWNLANGITSLVASPPAVTYTANGTFPVKFIVTDNNSCSDSITKSVIIGKPFASFNVNDTVCKIVTFKNNSIGGASSWNFGDGSSSNLLNPSHTYTAAGTYTVTLQVNAGACADDTIRKIFVEDIKAKFTSAPTYLCDLPASINYIDQSTNAAVWSWTFVSSVPYIAVAPGKSILQNPVIKFSNSDTNQYSIYKEEYVGVKLVVTSLHGCKDSISISKFDTINLPTARFMPDKKEGCVPLTVQFSDSSISKEKIVNWKYVFGDGSIISGSNPNPSHTYTASGTYYAMLIIQNSKGCLDTSYSIKIVVGKLPSPDFSAAPLNVCPGVPVQFTDLTPLSDSVDTWHYSTDALFMMSGCPGTGNPTWSFIGSTGAQNVTLTVGSKGCYSSVTKNSYINVKGPIAEFRTATDCDSPRVYVFTGKLQDADSWTWNLGDGTVLSNSTSQQITHTYAASGNYKVTLTAVNNTSGCPASVDTATAFVRQIKAKLQNFNPIFCSGTPIPFDASASVDVQAECNSGYYWLWGDGTGPGIFSAANAQHIFVSSGFMNVKLIVKDANGCRDTLVQRVKASGLTPKFAPDKFIGCLPLVVKFTDQSVSDTIITNWNWDFGNGGTSTLQNPSYTFAVSGANSFVVTETVKNILGCTNTYSVLIKISKPDPTFKASTKTTICAGDSVKFDPNFKNNLGYLWDFGDGSSTSSVQSPYHVFKKGGDYSITLQVTDSIGCQGVASLFNYIHVQDYPIVGFTTPSVGAPNCYPLLAQFTDTSKVNSPNTRVWDLGNNSPTVTNPTVGTVYQLPGTYVVSLTVTTTYGCTSKLTKSIKVNGPLADFSLSPSLICKGSTVQFIIKDTARVFTYHWDFGDGYDTTAISPIKHTFNYHPPSGQGVVTLICWSDDSSCSHAVTHNIAIHQVTADFKRNNEIAKADTAHCLNIPDLFSNTSTNANPTWSWDFGDGTTSNIQNPPHTYTSAGTYSVQLSIANSQLGCVDTFIKKMIIFPEPVIKIVDGDTCLGSSVQLGATGGISYVWDPPTGLNSTSIANPIATPTITTDYSVTVSDNNGCTGIGTAHVYIQQQPLEIDWDTSIVIGQSLTLNAVYLGSDFTYSWSPSDTLSCTNCGIPTIKPLSDKYFTVTVSDSMGCFRIESHIKIHILPKSSLDVPSAFTPNGDGTNDIVYVGGWGIKKLIEFKIYNRWGELLFVSNDLLDGWDGKYKGVPQNIETYAYTVIAETYIDKEPLTKKGYIKIIK